MPKLHLRTRYRHIVYFMLQQIHSKPTFLIHFSSSLRRSTRIRFLHCLIFHLFGTHEIAYLRLEHAFFAANMYFHCEDALFTEKLHLPLRARAASVAKKNREKRQLPLRARAAASELRSAGPRRRAGRPPAGGVDAGRWCSSAPAGISPARLRRAGSGRARRGISSALREPITGKFVFPFCNTI